MKESLHIRLPAEHVEADALFLRHQEALLARDFAAAEARLAEVRTAVARHIAEEEGEALPLYRALGPAPRGGDADLIVAEHRKIEQLLAGFADRLAAWRDREADGPLPPAPREVIALLDAEAQFKHLMDHHDRRERSFLYPALARMADASDG